MEEFEEAILLSVWTRNFGSRDQIAEKRKTTILSGYPSFVAIKVLIPFLINFKGKLIHVLKRL